MHGESVDMIRSSISYMSLEALLCGCAAAIAWVEVQHEEQGDPLHRPVACQAKQGYELNS